MTEHALLDAAARVGLTAIVLNCVFVAVTLLTLAPAYALLRLLGRIRDELHLLNQKPKILLSRTVAFGTKGCI